MSLRKQSALIFATSLVQLVAGMAAGIFTARLLGPEGKGIALLAFFVPGFITSLGTFSLGEASVYFLGQGEKPGRIVASTLQQSFGLGAIYFLGALVFFGPLRASVIKDVPTLYAVAGLATLPLMLVKNLGDAVLVGLKRVPWFVAGNLTLHTLRAAALFTALVVLRLGVKGAVGAELVTWLVTGVIYILGMVRGVRLEWGFDRALARRMLGYGMQTHIGNIAQRMNLQVSTVILSSLTNATSVGLFSVATNSAQVLWYIPDSVGRLLFPRVASSSRADARQVTQAVCRHVLLLTVLASLSLFAVGPLLVRILYGREFQPSVVPLFWLLPGIVALSISKVLTKYLSGVGKPFMNSVASIASFAVNAPLLWILVQWKGIVGAAMASSIAYMVHAVTVLIFFHRESGGRYARTLVPDRADLKQYTDMAGRLVGRLRKAPRS